MHISIIPETIVEIFGLPITNSLLMSWLAMVFLCAIAFIFNRTFRDIPGRLQAAIEFAFETFLRFMDGITQDRRKSEKFLPLVATIFFFVITANWMGLIPGVGSIVVERGREAIPLFRPVNTDLNNTLALALIAVLATHLFGLRALGPKHHFGKFLNLRGPIDFFVGLLEAVGEFARILSFSFRLFGNVFAGEVLLLVIGGLVPILVPVPFLGLEVFVGFIQALVFAMLTLVFLTIATATAEEHH